MKIYIHDKSKSRVVWDILTNTFVNIFQDFDYELVTTDKYITNDDILITYTPFIDDIVTKYNYKVLLIQTEPLYIFHKLWYNIRRIIRKFNNKIHVIEYQPKNITFFKNKQVMKDIYTYCPFSFLPIKIFDNNEKTYDILFYGSLTPRRIYILDQLKNKYSIIIKKNFKNLEEQNYYVSRAKIVLSIFFCESNNVFDYFRLSPLISSKIFYIAEKSENLNECQHDGVFCKYDEFINTISKYMEFSQKQRNIYVDENYQLYKKKFNYRKSILNILNNFSD
jgi:hypothetical protein